MDFGKAFRVYKPTEELMYVNVDTLIERLSCKLNRKLTFVILDKSNSSQYSPEGFFSAGSFVQDRAIVVGVVINGQPAGYGVGVMKGGKGAYFKVKYSDICFDGIYTFPEYRGKGVAHSVFGELLRLAKEREDIRIASLNVRTDNFVAKKMYENLGFETKRTVTFLKKWRFKFPYYGI